MRIDADQVRRTRPASSSCNRRRETLQHGVNSRAGQGPSALERVKATDSDPVIDDGRDPRPPKVGAASAEHQGGLQVVRRSPTSAWPSPGDAGFRVRVGVPYHGSRTEQA